MQEFFYFFFFIFQKHHFLKHFLMHQKAVQTFIKYT